ncbi:MAG: hypothetical protein IJ867_01370 [Clostridia bacterium]|nr:hypothetical protein [Clostridia bacterium]
MDIINKIREKQNEIIVMINSAFDEIVKEVENLKIGEMNYENNYETSYPITNTTGFKGRKPIAIKINDERMIAPTWKKVVEEIMNIVIQDETMKKRVLDLRDKLLGRKRRRISNSDDDMRSPLKLTDELYIETHYDTETLMNLLIQILGEISYDYSNIQIIVKN